VSATKAGRTAAALLTLAFVVFLAGCRSGETERQGGSVLSSEQLVTKETTYKTKTVKYEELTRTSELDADPSFVFSKTVSSGNREYVLKELRAARGQQVKKGDVLAVLQGTGSEADVEELRLQIEYYRASGEETAEKLAALAEEAERESADNIYDEEIRQLRAKKAWAAYKAHTLSVERNLKSMMKRLEEAEAGLEPAYVYSPIDGQVKTVASGYKPGDVIKANTVLYAINYTGAVLYYASSTSGAFVYNREVTLRVGRGQKQATVGGKVVSSPEVMPEDMIAGGVFVEVRPEDLPYGPGHAELSVEYVMMKDALLVDKSAVETDEGLSYVLLLDGGAVKKRYIVRGPGTGTLLSVVQGLKEGDRVILSSYNAR